MDHRQTTAGLILAGGRSLRFGGEKATATLGDRPLLLWAAQRLQTACGAVAVNARAGSEAEIVARAAHLPILHDAPGDPDGPLAGIRVGLLWAAEIGARALAVSPCDAPGLPDDLYLRLASAAGAGAGAALAETADGLQPLCAVWPTTALPVVSEALSGGAHPPAWRVLESLGAARVRFEDTQAFANLNTRADLAAAEDRLKRS